MQPRHADDLAVELRHQTTQGIERQEMPHVAAGIRRRAHHGRLRVAECDVVERQEVDVAGAVGVPLLQRPDDGLGQ
jgi:hypothetical protein